MHSVVIDRLEEYLADALDPAARRHFEAHLNACENCREEVRSMQDVGDLFTSLRPDAVPSPSPAFFAGVMRKAAGQRVPSFAALFALDFAFGRRLVFASLLTLAILG